MKNFTNTQILAFVFSFCLMIAFNTQLQAQKKAPLSMDTMTEMSNDIDAPVVLEINDTPDSGAAPIMILNERSAEPATPVTPAPEVVANIIIKDEAPVQFAAPKSKKDEAAWQSAHLRDLFEGK